MDGASKEEELTEIPEKTPAEVIQDLEEVLSSTIEELEQQKRLNQSLLKRKVREEFYIGHAVKSVLLHVCRISKRHSSLLLCKDLAISADQLAEVITKDPSPSSIDHFNLEHNQNQSRALSVM